jgi:glucose/arabinose dehydrogenase
MQSKYFLPLLAALAAAPACLHAQPTTPAQNTLKPGETGPDVPAFQVRPGYRVTVASEKLGETRFLEVDDKGTLYVSQPNGGTILALKDHNRDGVYETRTKFIEDKKTVHGMHFYKGWLWFTQSGAVHRAQDTNNDGVADKTETIVGDGLPSGGGHWWRSIVVTDDGFYTSIGDAGNISDQSDTERQKLWKFSLDGKNRTLVASGLRNTEKLRLRPGTAEVWGADHGSDNYGKYLGENGANQPVTDVTPPCEFNHYVQDGFYGHPFVMGNKIPREEYSKRPDILELVTKTIVPAWPLGAHWAPNGWTFLTKNGVASPGDALIACHGSWNSSKKVGYRVERIMFDRVTGRPFGALPLVSTLDGNGNNLGRPCDVVEAPDGSVLWSDTQNQRVFRLTQIR